LRSGHNDAESALVAEGNDAVGATLDFCQGDFGSKAIIGHVSHRRGVVLGSGLIRSALRDTPV
jgi:hypothetical protein